MSRKQLKDQLLQEKTAFYATFDLHEDSNQTEGSTIDSYAALQVSLGSELDALKFVEQDTDGVRYTVKRNN